MNTLDTGYRGPRPLRRRTVLAAGLGLAATIAHARVALPVRKVTVILPFGLGGSADVIARALGAGMAEELGLPIVMDNRPGASGAIAASAAARAPGDGSTLFFGASSTQSVLPNVRTSLPFDPVADFTPISMVAEVENALVVTPSLPVRSVGDLVADGEARPGNWPTVPSVAAASPISQASFSRCRPASTCCTCPTRPRRTRTWRS
ncbi:Argininosuccinate lyase (plasmid) [Variovorax sp. RA8]|nr:Argininosuccinate lyase [Variovorax sp. RA8]